MEIMAAPTTTLWPLPGMRPRDFAISATMNENSPICASPPARVSAVFTACPLTITMRKASNGVTKRIMPSTPMSSPGAAITARQSNSIPTETKKSTAKTLRIGRTSAPA